MPPPVPAAAQPTRKIFDPWNTHSTGHQRAESREGASTSWRAHRTAKLRQQYSGKGARRNSSGSVNEETASVPLGPGDEIDPVGEARAQKGITRTGDIAEWMRSGGTRGCGRSESSRSPQKPEFHDGKPTVGSSHDREDGRGDESAPAEAAHRPIFANLTFYINGSTMPRVSDHRLKQLLSQHGGRVALGHARRTVTHIIIGKPNAGPGAGAGGGLAAGKIEKEVRSRNRGHGVGPRFISVDW